MTGYSVRAWAFGALWAGLFCFAAIAPAPAQETAPRDPPAEAPRSLVPSKPAVSPAGAGAVSPLSETPKPDLRGPPPQGDGEKGQPIKVGELPEIDPDSVGLLDDANSGFGVDMWKGTSRSLVERLLPKLPAAVPSPVMRGLTRRLLLSSATPPEGTGSGRSLVAMRVEKLAAMGDPKVVGDLLRVAPSRLEDEALARARIDNAFLTNDNAGACSQIRALIRQYQGAYWQKALSFCQALAGEHARAALGAGLLRELGHGDDQVFFTLIAALGGDKGAVVESLPKPAPLHLAMLRAARQRLPEDVLQTADAAILRTVAISPNAALDLRLEAAERAEAVGALPSDSLAQIYASVTFSPEQLANAFSQAEADRGPRGRALLYQATAIQSVPTAQAEILRKAWALARESGGYQTSVRVHLPTLGGIAPAMELAWFAEEAGRALLIAGRYQAAAAWLALTRQASPPGAADAMGGAGTQTGQGAGQAAENSFWSLIQLADATDSLAWEADALNKWWESSKSAGTDGLRARATALFTLLEAFDKPVDAKLWQPLLEGPHFESVKLPAPALLHALNSAAAERRIGATVLLTLICLGEDGPTGADPLLLRAVISGLREVGLEKEARALAVEAAIGAGI
ncbi:MAG: hypothetical protein IID53_00125 [Proteobacteria bacterium]|nr:hypothetical protein [Pseudomonadota bacterium]